MGVIDSHILQDQQLKQQQQQQHLQKKLIKRVKSEKIVKVNGSELMMEMMAGWNDDKKDRKIEVGDDIIILTDVKDFKMNHEYDAESLFRRIIEGKRNGDKI